MIKEIYFIRIVINSYGSLAIMNINIIKTNYNPTEADNFPGNLDKKVKLKGPSVYVFCPVPGLCLTKTHFPFNEWCWSLTLSFM